MKKKYIKIGIIVISAIILICVACLIIFSITKDEEEEVDPNILNSEVHGYMQPIFENIADMNVSTITITREDYSVDKDNNAGEKKVTKITYDDEKKLYLNRVVEDNRSKFNYLTYINGANSYYIWGGKAGSDGLIVDGDYIKDLVRWDILSFYDLIEEYRNDTYGEFLVAIENDEIDLKELFVKQGYEVTALDIKPLYSKDNETFKFNFIVEYSLSKESKITSNKVSLEICFDKDKLLNSKFSMISSVANNANEIISYNHEVSDVSYKYEYDKAFYNTVNRPSKMPTNKVKTKYNFYQDGELIDSGSFQYGTNYATRFGNSDIYDYVNGQYIYSDETYLEKYPIVDRVNGYAKSYEDSIFYAIKMPGEGKSKIIVVYLYQDGNDIEHVKTEYFMSNENRFEINTMFDSIDYADKISINGREHAYKSFGLLEGNVYIVHCYDVR